MRIEPNNALDWLNSILSADNKKTFFSLSNSKVTRKNPEWGTYKKFKYISLKDGRGYLMPFNRDLYSKALELYNVQSRKAKLFKVASGITGGKWFTIPVRLIFNRELKYSENNEIYIFEYFKKLFNRNDVEFAVSLGTPGPHRKPVIQIISDTGEVVAFIKLGSDCTNALVQNEANTLKCFTDFSSELFCIPSVLKYGWWKNHFFAIQPPSDGDLLPAPQELNSQHIGVLNELAEFSNTTATLGESKFWKELKIKLEAINDSDHFLNIINKALNIIEKKLSNTTLQFHFSHGDFTPWNTYMLGEKLYIFDWEYSDSEAIPGRDFFHFVFQTSYHLKKRSSFDTYNTILKSLGEDFASPYWSKLCINKDKAISLFILYIIERITFIVSQKNKNFSELSYFSNILMYFISSDGEIS